MVRSVRLSPRHTPPSGPWPSAAWTPLTQQLHAAIKARREDTPIRCSGGSPAGWYPGRRPTRNRYRDEIGCLLWAAPHDWMCEPWITAKTGLTVAEH